MATCVPILEVDSGDARLFVPVKRGCTSHPFFAPGDDSGTTPSTESRCVQAGLPAQLRGVYAKFPPTTEFRMGDWTFLCEEEIRERTNISNFVDLAVKYEGMGHVTVLAALKDNPELVFEMSDGGANGLERDDNARARQSCNPADHGMLGFPTWLSAVTGSLSDVAKKASGAREDAMVATTARAL